MHPFTGTWVISLLSSLHQSAGGVTGHRGSHWQDSLWMKKYPIFVIMTSSLFPAFMFWLKAIPTTDHFSGRLITVRLIPGGQKRHKTDDSISVITENWFHLLSIQLASSLPSQLLFSKNKKCHLFAWGGCQFRLPAVSKAKILKEKPNNFNELSGISDLLYMMPEGRKRTAVNHHRHSALSFWGLLKGFGSYSQNLLSYRLKGIHPKPQPDLLRGQWSKEFILVDTAGHADQ